MLLVLPSAVHLPDYVAALRRGWSADTARAAQASQDELAEIEADAAAYLARQHNPRGGGEVTLPDGSRVQRLPGTRRWILADDGRVAGLINLRWAPGTMALPPHVLGHIGYAVMPWYRRQGLARRALAALLPEARALGLAWVELTTDPDNLASQGVILANGGQLVEHFIKPAAHGGAPGLRYRILL